jgi:hypothetical protein
MLANITKGQDFSGCLRYVLGKAGAERIGGNMEGATVGELQREFDLGVQCQQRRSPQKVTQAVVCHTSLSVEVGRNLDNATWNAIATGYLTAMGFINNQFIAVRHTDTKHDHIHLVVSRLRLDGTTVETWLDYRKAQEVLRRLERQYQLQSVQPSWEVEVKPASVGEIRQFQRTGEPSIRAMLQVAIDETLSTATTIDQFQSQLAQLGVAVRLRQIQSGIAGISYKLNDVAFPGYKLGKRYTWSRVQSQLEMNHERANSTTRQRENDAAESLTREFSTAGSDPDVVRGSAAIVDHEFRNLAATREPSEACASAGRSREEFDSREPASAAVREISAGKPSAIPTVESANRYLKSAISAGDSSSESDFGGISGERSSATKDNSDTSTIDRAGKNSDNRAAEPVRPNHPAGQRTSATRSSQTGVAQDLRTDDDVRNLDRLHDRSDVASSASTTTQSEPARSTASDAEESGTPLRKLKSWQDYSDSIQEKNPVKRDLIVAQLALMEGLNAGVNSRENFQQVKQLLWQSPYVQWLQEEQGLEKTRTYVKLTLQAAYRENQRSGQPQRSQQRQRYRSRQQIR